MECLTLVFLLKLKCATRGEFQVFDCIVLRKRHVTFLFVFLTDIFKDGVVNGAAWRGKMGTMQVRVSVGSSVS